MFAMKPQVADSLDDLLHKTYQVFVNPRQRSLSASRGQFKEELGVTLRLKNPRARLSRSESRGRVLSCLGEFLWYLSASDRLDFIEYYVHRYRMESVDGVTVPGAYGPRLFGPEGQFKHVLDLLRARPTSRRAVVQLFAAADISHHDCVAVPCTCTIQFVLRGGDLHCITYMRSNDAWFGLPHDVFAFTMLQELAATTLGVGLGQYTHIVGSLHVYDEHIEAIQQYMAEGWHDDKPMPAMPSGDPWPAVDWLLRDEQQLRTSSSLVWPVDAPDPYWNDLALLLRILWAQRNGAIPGAAAEEVKGLLRSNAFLPFVDDRLRRARGSRKNATQVSLLPAQDPD